MSTRSARSYILFSIGAALLTMAIKLLAYYLTGSVGLLSDALESTVNLVASLGAFWALSVAALPPDAEHPYGHSKAEYFSSGLESSLILVAAAAIIYTALGRFGDPQPLTEGGLGLALALLATAINGFVALLLLRASRKFNSITLRADAYHLLTDVWTSIGVVVAVGLVLITGWQWLDPTIALVVGLNIIWTGYRLLRESLSSLMDQSLPKEKLQLITAVFDRYETQGIRFHLLKTRLAGTECFVAFHVLVPGDWTVQRGHDLCEALEAAIAEAIPFSHITTHLEPLEDPKSWQHSAYSDA